MAQTDLLLLNASNYPRVPLYPYAFVQVAEIARRHGLRVASVDLMGVPERALRGRLGLLIEQHRPRAVGVHLRQLDSLFVEEYRGYWPRDLAASPSALPGGARVGQDSSFRPVEATARLVTALRDLTPAPILLGGHGFTSNPAAVFRRIAPDVAVVGEPDGVFARFDDVLAGRGRASIPNLMFEEGGGVAATPRVEFGPAPGTEYTPEIIDDIRRFYGIANLEQQTFPVEVMRGCPYHCYFCCEPAVKGREARIRPLDAVIEDVELLARHGLARIWMVCSELNVFGPDLALELSERLIRLRERAGVEVRWYAFSLPSRMNVDIWRTLARSGFRGGFNTVMSLDDENLEAGRIPHRAIDAIEEYKNIETVARELPPGDEIRSRGTLALFLGNAYATPRTIARSLAALHAHGLLETVRVPGIMVATRVFETLPRDDRRAEGDIVTFGPAPDLDLSLPTFEYPAALLGHFGGRRPFERFMRWLDLTVLSRAFEATLDWSHFLASAATPGELAGWLDDEAIRARWGADPGLTFGAPGRAPQSAPSAPNPVIGPILHRLDPEGLRRLFLPDPSDRAEIGAAVHAVLQALFERHSERVSAALLAMGLPSSMDEAVALPVLELLARLYDRFSDVEGALAAVSTGGSDASVERLAARYVLYRRNVVLDAAWREPLLGGARPADRRSLPVI
ncbi:MAG: radical SAM protein [Polyangiaceae bacterium]|nr:radical SAM protein [Polyangiaceae bacterium]